MLERVDLLLPLVVLAVATLGLAFLVEPFVGWYFQWAWWSYVMIVEASNRRLGVPSFLPGRAREFLRLCGVSVVLWTLFEALNLRLGNWYYVMDHPSRAVRWVGGVVAFATVLPACSASRRSVRRTTVRAAGCRRPRSRGVENGGRATGRRSLRIERDRGHQASSREGPASQSRARRRW
jgi:hypothetical protein